MRHLWIILVSLLLFSCASIPSSSEISVNIDGYEKQEPKKRSKARVRGTNLGINQADNNIKEVATEQGASPARQQEKDSLEEILLLEIRANRGDNIKEIVEEMIEYARTRQNTQVAQRAYELSNSLYEQRFSKQASQTWYELEPANSLAQKAYFRELLISSDYEKAFEVMGKRISQGRDSDFTSIANFYQIVDAVQSSRVLDFYNRYINLFPEKKDNLEEGTSILRYKIAHFLFYQQEYERSLRLLNLVISSSKNTEIKRQATQLKGSIYFISQRSTSEAFFRQSLRSYRDSYYLNIQYALYLIEQGKKPQGEKHLIQYIKSDSFKDDNDYRLLIMGIGAIEEGLSKLYDEILKRVYALTDEDKRQLFLGVLSYANDEIAKTEDILSRVLISSEYASQAISIRIKNAIKSKDYEAANGILEDILEHSPELYIFLNGRYAVQLSNTGETAKAKKVIKDLLRQIPRDEYVYETAGYAYYEMDELAAMSRSFERAMRLTGSDDHGIKNSYGYCLTDKNKDLDKAKKLIDEAIEANPASPAYVDSLGWWHYRKGNLSEAKYLLEWALRNKNDPEIASHLGEVLWHLGLKQRAKYLWLTSSELFPASEILRNTMDRYNVKFNTRDGHFFYNKLLD